MWKIFVVTVQFLTRIPISKNYIIGDDELAKGVVFFPVIGLLIGLFDLLFYKLFNWMIGGTLPIAMVLLANVMITGGLHIDGLSDSCDGLFSGRKKERMLEIMKDSHIGAFGVIAIIFDFLFRFTLLSSIDHRLLPWAILLSPVVAKTFVARYIGQSEDAREGKGMGSFFMNSIKGRYSVFAVVLGMGILLPTIALGVSFFGAFFFCIIPLICVDSFTRKKIGGATGDIFGAMNEIIEIAFLLGILMIERIL